MCSAIHQTTAVSASTHSQQISALSAQTSKIHAALSKLETKKAKEAKNLCSFSSGPNCKMIQTCSVFALMGFLTVNGIFTRIPLSSRTTNAADVLCCAKTEIALQRVQHSCTTDDFGRKTPEHKRRHISVEKCVEQDRCICRHPNMCNNGFKIRDNSDLEGCTASCSRCPGKKVDKHKWVSCLPTEKCYVEPVQGEQAAAPVEVVSDVHVVLTPPASDKSGCTKREFDDAVNRDGSNVCWGEACEPVWKGEGEQCGTRRTCRSGADANKYRCLLIVPTPENGNHGWTKHIGVECKDNSECVQHGYSLECNTGQDGLRVCTDLELINKT